MKCSLLLCAENIILDYGTRRLSAINILQDWFVSVFPVYASVFAYIQIDKELNEEISDTFLEVKFNDNVISRNKIDLNYMPGTTRCGTIMVLGIIPINSEGTLNVTVIYNGTVLSSYPIKYIKVEKNKLFTGVIPPLPQL